MASRTLNQIERLARDVGARFPDTRWEVDEPADESGAWMLDLRRGGQTITVEWRPNRGFGISTLDPDAGLEGYGEGPDEVASNVDAATTRVVELLETGGKTIPPESVRLRDLRAIRRVSQEAMADRLGVGQPSVAKHESRADAGAIQVGTLRRVVCAMGGRLRVVAQFPDGMEREILVGDAPGDEG